MRSSKLHYPIAIVNLYGITGGRDTPLRSNRYWGWLLDEGFLDGSFDDAIVFDATGSEYRIVRIELRPTTAFRTLIESAKRLFLPPATDDRMVAVELDLECSAKHSIPDFCSRIKELALSHPEWWTQHYGRLEIDALFSNVSVIADAINEIGHLSGKPYAHPPGKSLKVLDHRNKSDG